MLTHLHIKNFKAWKDTGPIRLAPLTVIFGANSAGKSSLGHLLMALKQTTLLTDRKRAIHMGDQNSLIDLGTFADCLYGHNADEALEVELGWKLPHPVSLENPLSANEHYRGNAMHFETAIRADKHGQPKAESFQYQLLKNNATVLQTDHWAIDKEEPEIKAEPLRLVMKQGRKWPIDPPEKFYRFADVTLARYQNADVLTEFPLQFEQVMDGLSFLGPMRVPPQRTYSWAGDSVPDVGLHGQFAIPALLSAQQEGRELNRGGRTHYRPFEAVIANWLKELGVISDFTVQRIAKGRKDYEVLVRTGSTGPHVRLTDVGFGTSQVLPALVQAFYAEPNSTVWMEQPEIHLHPHAQAGLADALIRGLLKNSANSRIIAI